MTAPRDPSAMARHVDAGRLALRTAGPHSGLVSAEARTCLDKQLIEARDYLNEIAERVRARKEREAPDAR